MRALTLVVVVLFAPLAQAGPSEVSRARDFFQRGRIAFEAREFQAAVENFRSGFALTPKPLFVFNIAQSLRKWAESKQDDPELLGAARDEYRRYIDAAPPTDVERVDALRYLLEIESKLGAPKEARERGPDAPVLVPPLAMEQVHPDPPRLPPLTLAPSPAARPPEPTWLQRNGVWVAIAGGVIAAGAAAVGVWAATGCHASLGCVDARR